MTEKTRYLMIPLNAQQVVEGQRQDWNRVASNTVLSGAEVSR
jgi:Zn-dependent membrane protease YugP